MTIRWRFPLLLLAVLSGLTGCASTSTQQEQALTPEQGESVTVYLYPKQGRVADGRYVKLMKQQPDQRGQSR